MCSPGEQDEQLYMEKSLKTRKATLRSPERSTNLEELVSLKDMLDCVEWKENEERFFEILIPQEPKVREENEDQGSETHPII